MELSLKHQFGLVCVIMLFPALCHCNDFFTSSRASFYGYGTPSGACGFGEYGRVVNNGSVAAVSGKLWKNGAACGTCYQVRRKIPQYCSDKGAYVVVTDSGEGDRTDFILSPHAFSQLGSPKLIKFGVLDIEYKRVQCRYGYNIKFQINENSRNPGYFAVLILSVDGIYEVTAVELWQKNHQRYEPLRRVYGAVFDFVNLPSGEIYLRFQVSGSGGLKWVYPKVIIPSNWKPGAVYDTKVQLYY